MTSSQYLLRTSSVLLLALLVLVSGHGQQKKANSDLLEMEHYTLNMDVLKRLGETMRDFEQLEKSNPQLHASVENDGDKNEDLDAAGRRISANPQIVAVLKAHGFTPREFVLAEMVMFQSAFAVSAKEAGADPAKLASDAHVNPANITFIEQHKAEFEAMQKKNAAKENKPAEEGPDAP